VVDVCSDGSVTPIYPESGDTEGLESGKIWTKTTEVYVDPEQKTVTDYMKLLAFDKQVDVSFLTSDAAPRGDADDCFPLKNAMFRSRGVRVIRRDFWMTASQALRVRASE